jgi:probable addiction module antidote protein
MPSKLKSYHEWLGSKLVDPERAARYLNAAAEDSEAMFLKALRKVALSQNRSMTEIAESCGVSRESLYRMLSETGNPTSENRRAILAVLGFKSVVVPIQTGESVESVEVDPLADIGNVPPAPPSEQVSPLGAFRIEDLVKGGIGTMSYGPPLFSNGLIVTGGPGNTSIGAPNVPSVIDILGYASLLEPIEKSGTVLRKTNTYSVDPASGPGNINPELLRLLNA